MSPHAASRLRHITHITEAISCPFSFSPFFCMVHFLLLSSLLSPRIAPHYCTIIHKRVFGSTLGGSSSRGRSLFMRSLSSCFSSLFLLGPVLSDTSYLLPNQYSACGISTAVLSAFLRSNSHIRTSHLAFPAPHRIGICCTVQCFNAYCICIISRFEKYFCYHAIYVPCHFYVRERE